MPLTLFFGNYLRVILSSDRGENYVNKSNAPATYDIIFAILRMINKRNSEEVSDPNSICGRVRRHALVLTLKAISHHGETQATLQEHRRTCRTGQATSQRMMSCRIGNVSFGKSRRGCREVRKNVFDDLRLRGLGHGDLLAFPNLCWEKPAAGPAEQCRLLKMRPAALAYRLTSDFTCRSPFIAAAFERSMNSERPGGRGLRPSFRM